MLGSVLWMRGDRAGGLRRRKSSRAAPEWVAAMPIELRSTIELGETLGSGLTAEVVAATRTSDGRQLAIKVIDKRRLKPRTLELTMQEVKVLRRVSHPNIVNLLAAYEEPDWLFLVLERCRGGELFRAIADRHHYTEDTAKTIAVRIAHAIMHLHSLGVMHRDLKPENVLLVDEGDASDVKLCDFGMAKLFDHAHTVQPPEPAGDFQPGQGPPGAALQDGGTISVAAARSPGALPPAVRCGSPASSSPAAAFGPRPPSLSPPRSVGAPAAAVGSPRTDLATSSILLGSPRSARVMNLPEHPRAVLPSSVSAWSAAVGRPLSGHSSSADGGPRLPPALPPASPPLRPSRRIGPLLSTIDLDDCPPQPSVAAAAGSALEPGATARGVPAGAAPALRRTSTVCGSAHYVAPEVLARELYSFKADWYSFGAFLHALLAGEFPPETGRGATEPPELTAAAWDDVSADARDAVRALLHPLPALRADGTAFFRSRWVSGSLTEQPGAAQLTRARTALRSVAPGSWKQRRSAGPSRRPSPSPEDGAAAISATTARAAIAADKEA